MAVEAQTMFGDWLPIDNPAAAVVASFSSSFGYQDYPSVGDAGLFQCSSSCQQQSLPMVMMPRLGTGFLDVGFVDGEGLVAGADHRLGLMPFARSLAAELDLQLLEVDLFLKLQSERLKCAIEQQRKQQMGFLLNRIETWAVAAMRDKDQELAKARTKSKELEERLSKAEKETETWKQTAKEKEAMAMDLTILLQQINQNKQTLFGPSSSIINQDAESICECNDNHNDNDSTSSTSKAVIKKRKKTMGLCRGCNGGGACIVFLPCKHLCSCKSCEGFLSLCPVCHSVKQAAMEVYL